MEKRTRLYLEVLRLSCVEVDLAASLFSYPVLGFVTHKTWPFLGVDVDVTGVEFGDFTGANYVLYSRFDGVDGFVSRSIHILGGRLSNTILLSAR